MEKNKALESFNRHFGQMKDPRDQRGLRHSLKEKHDIYDICLGKF